MLREDERFDYIIVGGGSAGCVLANRLSTDPAIKVCLLEAGPPDTSPLITIPAALFFLLRSKKYNWKYKCIEQARCNNRILVWPCGKTLGGSSAINAMCYIRGNPEVYDEWEKLGNGGWSYHEVLPYFEKLEKMLSVSQPRYINMLTKKFVVAAQQAGYSFAQDIDNKGKETVGYFRLAQVNGERCSNARAYLHPIVKRKNLTIVSSCQVVKVIFDNHKHAVGVCYLKKGKMNELFARKEIIISAGAIGSPKLLMLSGIGKKYELQKLDIPVVQDLPGVGENLQDHVDIHVSQIEKTRYAISLQYFNPYVLFRNIKAILLYIFKRKGELTCNYAQGVGFIKSDSSLPYPDIEWHFLPNMETRHAQYLWPAIRYFGYTLKSCLLYPKSRGKVLLRSANPLDQPVINPNYFSDSSDLDALIKAVKIARNVLNQPAFKEHRLKDYELNSKIQTDEQIRDYILQYAETIYHPVGTCKMGNDNLAVVDEKLRVYGVKNLRVVDASIMPLITAGNTNTPVTMIAEKAADMILNDRE